MAAPTALGPIIERKNARVLVGTRSWTDRTLTQESVWYLLLYFPPSPELMRSWAERTPAGFTMNVKAYSLFTGHRTTPGASDLRGV
jgi:hypothetical protein